MGRIHAAVLLALAATSLSACGGSGKKAYSLTKAQYTAALDKICLVAADQLRELHLDNALDTYKARGDDIVAIIDRATGKFEALTPPDSVKDAAKRFNEANERLLADTKDAASAAKAGDRTKFEQGLAKADADNRAGRGPATEIGATGCV
jgi:hypothetical protein